MELILFLLLFVVVVVLLIIYSGNLAKNKSLSIDTKKTKENLTNSQTAVALFVVVIGIAFNIFSMPIILIIGILLKIFKGRGEFVIAYYKGLKVLAICYLILVIVLGLCMSMGSLFG